MAAGQPAVFDFRGAPRRRERALTMDERTVDQLKAQEQLMMQYDLSVPGFAEQLAVLRAEIERRS